MGGIIWGKKKGKEKTEGKVQLKRAFFYGEGPQN